jgi:uncharacterized protein (TIGR02118 family)
MIVLHAIYANTPGARFDEDYYREKHMPMVKRVLGTACKGVSYASGISGGEPDSKSPFIAIGTVYFDSLEAFQAEFPPQAPQIMADVKNYTDIEPVIQISEVQLLDITDTAVART